MNHPHSLAVAAVPAARKHRAWEMAESKTRTGFQVYFFIKGIYPVHRVKKSKIASWACGTPEEMPGKGRHHVYRESFSGVCSLSTAREGGIGKKSTTHTFSLVLGFGSTCSDHV